MTPDHDLLGFLKEWVILPAAAILGIAWRLNAKEHADLTEAQAKLREAQDKLRDNTSSGYSTLNDRVIAHVDERVEGLKHDHGDRIEQINKHVVKLFENAEKDRAAFRDALTAHSQQSTERHIELMSAIHIGLAKKVDR